MSKPKTTATPTPTPREALHALQQELNFKGMARVLAPGVTSNPLGIEDWSGDIGLPLPSTHVRVVDDHDVEVAAGQVGEICVRGPQVMAGYWKQPKETIQVFTSGGWLHTGDMGLMNDAGSLRITDRKKDIIIISGFKVFPNEIEDVVTSHSGVLEVGAVGVPNEHSGESVKIVVVKRDPLLTEQELLEHCRQQLTGYKMPSIVEFRVIPLPKSNIGKILRRQLR